MKSFPLMIVAGLTLTCLEGCYVAKPLDRDVHISINTDFPVNIKNTGTSNFSGKHTDVEYGKYYVDGMMAEFTANHIVIDAAAPEFIVKITSLEIAESTKLDTVKDVKSKDNGMVRDLTMALLKTSGTVTKVGSSTSSNWDADKDDAEKLTHNSNVGQVILGQNKDGEVWRENAFDDSEYLTLSAQCGRRAAVRITQDVKRLIQ